jgi:hypothetical protein
MTKFYKGQRVSELLEAIKVMEERLKILSMDGLDPYSEAQYHELAHGYASLALAKAKLTSMQGEE